MTQNIFKNLLILSIIGLIAFSCKDDASMIGLEIQPNSDKIAVSCDSTTSIYAYTLYGDSLIRSNPAYSLIGSYVDPIFGKTKAEFTFRMKPKYLNINFDDNLQADSLVIYFKYHSYYGDTLTPQDIKIYELKDSLDIDSTYYSQLHMEHSYDKNKILVDTTIIPRPNSSNLLTIKLPNQLADRILSSDTSVFSSSTNFINKFKGFYVTTNQVDADGSILSLNLLSSSSVIKLYYSTITDTVSKSSDFIVDYSNRYNLFYHDYSSSTISHIGDSTYTDSVIYIQPMNGLRGEITIPDLSALTNQGIIIINKAELIIETEDSLITQSNIYKIPAGLTIEEVDDEGKPVFITDYIKSNTSGVYYTSQAFNPDTKSYNFLITQYFQNLIREGKNSCSFYISASNINFSTNRVVLKNSQINGMKLLITYTKP